MSCGDHARAWAQFCASVAHPLPCLPLPHSNGYTLYSVQLSKPVGKNETVTLEVTSVRTHALIPKPAEITQKEPQLLLLTGNTYFTSPYPTKKQVCVCAWLWICL